MTNDPNVKDDSFTLVTSQRKNKKKHTKKRLEVLQAIKSSEASVVDEDLIVK